MHLSAPQPFCLEADWLNAQAFRWTKRDGWFYGIVGGQMIRVRNADADRIEFKGDAVPDAVKHYFRLDQDIERVHAELLEASPEHMPKLIKDYGHIRVLRQDPWECLVAYICSPKAKVERITDMVENLADKYGEPLGGRSAERKSFPSPQQLAEADEADLEDLGFGLSKGLTIHQVAGDAITGDLDLNKLTQDHVSHAEARERLMCYDGIGYKIADCVCLFSLGHDGAFPVDANIGAALERYYGRKFMPGAKNVRLQEWARETFGKNAGYAGQLLFLDQRSRIRERQRMARYASEDSTIVIHGPGKLEPGEHPHHFENGSSILHIHPGGDTPHSHREEDVMSQW